MPSTPTVDEVIQYDILLKSISCMRFVGFGVLKYLKSILIINV